MVYYLHFIWNKIKTYILKHNVRVQIETADMKVTDCSELCLVANSKTVPTKKTINLIHLSPNTKLKKRIWNGELEERKMKNFKWRTQNEELEWRTWRMQMKNKELDMKNLKWRTWNEDVSMKIQGIQFLATYHWSVHFSWRLRQPENSVRSQWPSWPSAKNKATKQYVADYSLSTSTPFLFVL